MSSACRSLVVLGVLLLVALAPGCGLDVELAAPETSAAEPPTSAPLERDTAPTSTVPPATVPIPPTTTPIPPVDDPVGGVWLGSPRLVGDLVMVPSDEQVLAFDATSGAPRWSSEACLYPDWASPVENPGTGAAVFVCDGSYTRIDQATGRVLWRYPQPDDVVRARVAGSKLLLATDSGLFVVDLPTGVELWSKVGLGGLTPTADAHNVYVGTDAGVAAFDGATGQELWSFPEPTSDIWAGRDAVYARTTAHWLVKVDGASGRVIWQSAVQSSRLDWSNVVGESDRAVMVQTAREQDRLTAFDSQTGEQIWTFDPPDMSEAVVSMAGTQVIVSNVDVPSVFVMDAQTGVVTCKFLDAVDATVVSADRLGLVLVDGIGLAFRLETLPCTV